jgi:hypothetical protein
MKKTCTKPSNKPVNMRIFQLLEPMRVVRIGGNFQCGNDACGKPAFAAGNAKG